LAYAGPYPKSITDEIDHVTVNATWDEMVEGANRDANPYMTPGQLTLANNVFCASLRRRLDSALQRDVLAVEIGLYGYLLGHGAQFSGDPNRANRGCLERTEFSDLVKQGYIIGY